MTERSRPSFRKPPINEVVCGVVFKPIANFEVTHYGLFWQTIADEYPRSRTVAPLNATLPIEFMPDERVTVPIQVVANAPEFPRVWLISKDDTCLVQLQPDRFLFNWRQRPDRSEYPRYNEVSRKFRALFECFQEFLDKAGLGRVAVQQTEMSYINVIRQCEVWSNFSEIGKVFPDLAWRSGSRFLPPPDGFAFRSNHTLKDSVLGTSIHSATSRSERAKVIRLDFTVHGKIQDIEESGFWQWFDRANISIVDAFVEITSPEMHRVWEREQ